MKNIEKKFKEWFNGTNGPAHSGLKFDEINITTYDKNWMKSSFEFGYKTAKSEYEAKLKAAVEVIEFYANKENWQWSAFNYFHAIYKEDSDDINCEDDYKVVYKTKSIGGKKAREFLKSQSEISK